MRAVAIGMIFGLPAAADRDRRRFAEFQYMRSDVRNDVGTVTEGRILGAGAAAIGDLSRYLLHDGWLDKIFVRKCHGISLS
jgi:hypothetical protein